MKDMPRLYSQVLCRTPCPNHAHAVDPNTPQGTSRLYSQVISRTCPSCTARYSAGHAPAVQPGTQQDTSVTRTGRHNASYSSGATSNCRQNYSTVLKEPIYVMGNRQTPRAHSSDLNILLNFIRGLCPCVWMHQGAEACYVRNLFGQTVRGVWIRPTQTERGVSNFFAPTVWAWGASSMQQDSVSTNFGW